MISRTLLAFLAAFAAQAMAGNYSASNEKPPPVGREFRAAWIASVHNIDWPSATGMSAVAQQAQLVAMLEKLAALKINAVIFQIRPGCDALYDSKLEPWSRWLTGTMGKSPGYDPLAFCIREAHRRGIEVHAWFNPFRAMSNVSHAASANHISRARPDLVKRHGSLLWCDPAKAEVRQRALAVILDVTSRYDVDGIHLDDYFYPYPEKGRAFSDDRSPGERREIVDGFVQTLYASVKRKKPWVRVGISPFGIWRPGVPAGIQAGLDSYEQLACDSRKWLANGWVDYLAPQLYWSISPAKQSFPALLAWWRGQGTRPVWPGIATARISSTEDPGRKAAEISAQIDLSRRIGKNWPGHLHWSAKSLVTNRGGIVTELATTYTQPAAVPPMPWLSVAVPPVPTVSAVFDGEITTIHWKSPATVGKIAVQARHGTSWSTARITAADAGKTTIPAAAAIAVSAIDRFGNMSPPVVLAAD